jgi:P-type Ca2+ transporter type 2B
LKYLEKVNVDYEQYRTKYEPKMKFPFSSARKRMSVIVNYKDENMIFVKGASEMVLQTCNKWYNMDENRIEDITEHSK